MDSKELVVTVRLKTDRNVVDTSAFVTGALENEEFEILELHTKVPDFKRTTGGGLITMVVDREHMVNNVVEAAQRAADIKVGRGGTQKDAINWIASQIEELRRFDSNEGWEPVFAAESDG